MYIHLHFHICIHSIVLNEAQGKFTYKLTFSFTVHLFSFSYQISNFLPSVPDLAPLLGKVSLMWQSVP